MNNTWYDDTVINKFEQKEHLTNNHKCAVLIVGGGLAGLSLLYKLKKNNIANYNYRMHDTELFMIGRGSTIFKNSSFNLNEEYF